MTNPIARYTQWLHTRWPAGTVEKLPDAREDGTTAVPGVRIVGDLTGVPLLKFSSDTGARAVEAIAAEPDFAAACADPTPRRSTSRIVGGGVSGIAAALHAKKLGLTYRVFEATEIFSTVANFPKGKPIYTYPTDMTPAGELQFRSEVHPKEELLADLEAKRKEAGIEVTVARIERIERKGGVLLLHHGDKGRPSRKRAGRSWRSAAAATIAGWACPARTRTGSSTDSTTRRSSRGRGRSSSAAATRRSRRRSRSRPRARTSPSRTGRRSSPGPSPRTSRRSGCSRRIRPRPFRSSIRRPSA